MELQDIISSSLRKDMKELQQLQERLKEIKEECNKNIQRIKTDIQLDTKEVHECDSKKCLTELKKQFETFLADTSDFKYENEFLNKNQFVLNTQGFKDLIIRYLHGIEKRIDVRASYEEVLRIKERDVKERRKNKKCMIEFEIMRLERMIQKSKCCSSGDDMDAKRAKQSKKNCLVHFQILQTLLEDFSKEDLTNACFSSGFQQAFSSLFGENVEYSAPRLFFNMDKLEKQLHEEEFNKEIAMVVFKVLKNQLQQFITMQIPMDSDDQKTNHFFTEFTLYDARIAHDSMVNERTMHTQEGIISKDASEIDNNVARASHDKYNITKVQSSNNEMFENVFAHNYDNKRTNEKTKTDHKTLKEENVVKERN
ncbi:hypothetical protein Tco_0664379 [Tanacetum coccineum]